MAYQRDPQFTIEQLENKVLRMVEIAAITCDKLSSMSPDLDSDSIDTLGLEYVGLAKDIKVSLREYTQKLVDVPVSVQSVNSMRDHRELEVWTLKTSLALKQLAMIASAFNIPIQDPSSPQTATQNCNQMQES
jgi:hypothetical protein